MREGNFRLAYQSIKAARARSFLTMLGIVIGVMAVVLVVCIGQGIRQQVAGQLNGYGKNVLTVEPGAGHGVGLGDLAAASSGELLTDNDLRTVQRTPGVQAAVPLATATGSMRGDHTVTSPFIVVTNADFPSIVRQSFASGGFFDSGGGSKTVVLGANIAQKLFDNNAPLGQGLIWRGQRFMVSGIYNTFNAPPFSLEANFNDAVFVPYSTARQLSGGALGLYEILARTNDSQDTREVARSVSSGLVAARGGAQDVAVSLASDGQTASNQTIHLLTLLVVGAAVIALVVGGVGIMNVMLVSVTERMHEIGIRKAIGATNHQIMRQFVIEALVLSVIGAIIGLVLSAGIVGLLRLYTSVQAVLVWQVMVLTPLVAIAIGVFFGSVPALKAARKDPIEALRHE